jgi:hypothetical protein
MGWLERLARWQPDDELAPLLAHGIMLLIVVGMGACALVMLSL